jgi:Family of unknown function (DUF5947)
MTTGALERLVRRADARRRAAAERCDVCGTPLSGGHRHLLDVEADRVMCACRACSLLFVQEAASEGRYRLVPERRRRLPPFPTKRLGVPVGLAYFVPTRPGAVRAHYPSPVGATNWEVDTEVWQQVVADAPELDTLLPDVEALLVNTARGRQEHWIVPVDDCYRLVAVVRREWRGLSGGTSVWPEIDRFFGELTEHK